MSASLPAFSSTWIRSVRGMAACAGKRDGEWTKEALGSALVGEGSIPGVAEQAGGQQPGVQQHLEGKGGVQDASVGSQGCTHSRLPTAAAAIPASRR